MLKLNEIIVLSAQKGLKLQAQDGSMPPGHNGPRFNADTPARNTAHWLISFLWAYEHTGETRFQEAARRAADYLISPSCLPMKAAFWCRTDKGMDLSNGLIGQAWAIEALATAAGKLDNPEYGTVAARTFLLHPFDPGYALWHSINVDGSWLPLNLAYNQQVWFAMAGLLLLKHEGISEDVRDRVTTFLQYYDRHLFLNRFGLIHHAIPRMGLTMNPIKKGIRSFFDMKDRVTNRYLDASIGYHAFNLYAFAVLFMETQTDREMFAIRPPLMRAIAFLRTPRFAEAVADNKYGYSYNPVGFEAALTISAFRKYLGEETVLLKEIETWIGIQIGKHFSVEKGLMVKDTGDPDILAARIYELTRLPKHLLETVEIDCG